jgi:hypothetical protein
MSTSSVNGFSPTNIDSTIARDILNNREQDCQVMSIIHHHTLLVNSDSGNNYTSECKNLFEDLSRPWDKTSQEQWQKKQAIKRQIKETGCPYEDYRKKMSEAKDYSKFLLNLNFERFKSERIPDMECCRTPEIRIPHLTPQELFALEKKT